MQELVLPFHHRGSRDQTQVARLGSKCLCLLSHLPGFCQFIWRQGSATLTQAGLVPERSCRLSFLSDGLVGVCHHPRIFPLALVLAQCPGTEALSDSHPTI